MPDNADTKQKGSNYLVAILVCALTAIAATPLRHVLDLANIIMLFLLAVGLATARREKLFVAIFRNADSAATYFRLPPNRVVGLGAQVVL